MFNLVFFVSLVVKNPFESNDRKLLAPIGVATVARGVGLKAARAI